MPSRNLDLPETDPRATVDYFRGWHGLLPVTAGGGHRWTSITQLPMGTARAASLADLVESLDSGVATLDELMYPDSESGGTRRQGLYHAVGVTKERPPAGKRGAARDVDMIPGAWADFDVRDDSFRDWGHILEVVTEMDRLFVGPEIIVSTGSGGAHCYWRAEGGLTPEAATMYSTRIRRWVQHQFGVKVDNVAQANRVMRLPGSVRFPKGSKDLMREPVQVSMPRNLERFTDFTALEVVTEDTWRLIEDRITDERDRVSIDWDHAVDVSLQELSLRNADVNDADGMGARGELDSEGGGGGGGEGGGGWRGQYRRFEFELAFNREVDWAQILLPMGWTQYGEPDREGRRSWTRPGGGGKNPRSAVTDWEASPNVMSLLSDSEETGLSHLYLLADDAMERRHKLTKVRVAAELFAGGSIEGLVKTWLRDGR